MEAVCVCVCRMNGFSIALLLAEKACNSLWPSIRRGQTPQRRRAVCVCVWLLQSLALPPAHETCALTASVKHEVHWNTMNVMIIMSNHFECIKSIWTQHCPCLLFKTHFCSIHQCTLIPKNSVQRPFPLPIHSWWIKIRDVATRRDARQRKRSWIRSARGFRCLTPHLTNAIGCGVSCDLSTCWTTVLNSESV